MVKQWQRSSKGMVKEWLVNARGCLNCVLDLRTHFLITPPYEEPNYYSHKRHPAHRGCYLPHRPTENGSHP